MAKSINRITNNINKACSDVYFYITETPHYIFYWLWKEEICDFIKDNPDYEDKITVSVVYVSASYLGETSAYVDINLHNGFKTVTLHMWCNLTTFRKDVKKNWNEFSTGLTARFIKELELERDSLKEKLKNAEEKIDKLKNSIKPNENNIQ